MNDLIYKQQKKFIEMISKIIKLNKLSHSYLVEVKNYSGDMFYIKLFIKMILCNKENISYKDLDCSSCNICKLIDDNNYPDLKIIEADGNWIKKNQLLEVKNDFQNKSLLDNKKIYLIIGAEKLNSSSANTILKFLEEPEDNIIAILLTTNIYKVIDTIVSRCQILSLNNGYFNVLITDELISLLKYIVNKESLFINYNYIYESLLSNKEIAKRLLYDVELTFLNYLNNQDNLDNDKVISILKDCNPNKINKYIMIIEEEISKLVYNINYKIWLDCIFSRFMEV